MKKAKIRYYVGLDVHLKSTSYIVRDIEGNIHLEGKCASKGQDLHNILEPYLFSCVIGLETNTEIYPIYEYFIEKKYDIRAGNTVQLRNLIGKNDKLDARRLSDMLRLNTFPCAFIPSGHLKELRTLVKIRHNALIDTRRIGSQIQAYMRKEGISFVTAGESFSKKWLNLLKKYVFDNPQNYGIKSLYDAYIYLDKRLDDLSFQMKEYAKLHFSKEYISIIAHRGIGDILASYLISEIGNISRFSTEKKLRRYARVSPCTNESADKIYSSFLPKVSSRGLLRWPFVQIAHCIVKHNESIRDYYKKKKKQKKIAGKAIMCVASTVSDIIYKTLVSIA